MPRNGKARRKGANDKQKPGTPLPNPTESIKATPGASPAVKREFRFRERVSTAEHRQWSDGLLNQPLPHRIRWAAAHFDSFRGDAESWTVRRADDWRAYRSCPEDAKRTGRVVPGSEQTEWWCDPATGRSTPMRIQKADGRIVELKDATPASEHRYHVATDALDFLISLITDWVREAQHRHPELILPDSVCACVCRQDHGLQDQPDEPSWSIYCTVERIPLTCTTEDGSVAPSAGRYLVYSGDRAVRAHWPALQRELNILATSIENLSSEFKLPQFAVIYRDPNIPTLPLSSAWENYWNALHAATVPVGTGWKILDAGGAVVLSEATAELHNALGAEHERLQKLHAVPIDAGALPFELVVSDHPGGPWTPLPKEALSARMMTVGRGGAPATIVTAVERAMFMTGTPPDLHNAQNAHRPGQAHIRYAAGDFIACEELEVLRSAGRLLALSPVSPPGGEESPGAHGDSISGGANVEDSGAHPPVDLTSKQQKALDLIKSKQPILGKEIMKTIGGSFEHVRRGWFGAKGALTMHGVYNLLDGEGYRWKPVQRV